MISALIQAQLGNFTEDIGNDYPDENDSWPTVDPEYIDVAGKILVIIGHTTVAQNIFVSKNIHEIYPSYSPRL